MVKFVRACIGGGILLLIIHLIVKPLIEGDKNSWKKSPKAVIEKKIPDTVPRYRNPCKLLLLSKSECANLKKIENNPIEKR
jgi:hypothetical protein